MALNPRAEWRHPHGDVVSLDCPDPELVLTVIPGAGTHLILYWSIAQARAAHQALGWLLAAAEEGGM